MRSRRLLSAVACVALLAASITPTPSSATDANERIEYLLAPDFRMEGYDVVYNPQKDLNFLRDFPAVNSDGTVNAIIEIPAGDNRKFETSPDTGKMFWELKNGAPRIVKFLGYPGNYGAVPRTRGGDGDPLDIITLGRMDLRASVTPAKVIGVIHLLDGGEVDDKLIAVLPGTPLAGVNGIAELDAEFPGASRIIEVWLTSYKGPGEITSTGFDGPDVAAAVLQQAMQDFR